MFNNLSEKLDKALHVLKGHGRISEINVAETLKEVRRALLDADVNYKIAKEFTNRVKEKALRSKRFNHTSAGPIDGQNCKRRIDHINGW